MPYVPGRGMILRFIPAGVRFAGQPSTAPETGIEIALV